MTEEELRFIQQVESQRAYVNSRSAGLRNMYLLTISLKLGSDAMRELESSLPVERLGRIKQFVPGGDGDVTSFDLNGRNYYITCRSYDNSGETDFEVDGKLILRESRCYETVTIKSFLDGPWFDEINQIFPAFEQVCKQIKQRHYELEHLKHLRSEYERLGG